MLASISEEDLQRTLQNIPREWFRLSDGDTLSQLFATLLNRRERIRTLVAERLDFLAVPTLQSPKGHAHSHSNGAGALTRTPVIRDWT